MCATLDPETVFYGPGPDLDACPGLTFDRLSWTEDWHLREETYSKALAVYISFDDRSLQF